MSNLCSPKNVTTPYIEKQIVLQTTQKLYCKLVGFKSAQKVNRSIALTGFLLGACFGNLGVVMSSLNRTGIRP